MPASTEKLVEEITLLKEELDRMKKEGKDTADVEVRLAARQARLSEVAYAISTKQVLKG